VPEVHLPHLDDEEPDAARPPDGHEAENRVRPDARHRSKSLLKIGLEVLLIGTGVFLGLMGEQWRERAQHRELAAESLRRFREEIAINRTAVSAVKDYHATMKKTLDAYVSADPKGREKMDVQLRGLQPATFERSAWDLAFVTQSLAHIDPQLVFSLSRIYTLQQGYADLSNGILHAMYIRTPDENLAGFFSAVAIYYGDIVIYEPKLLELYDEVSPRIDRALGVSSPERPR
jgi:hypothetical protein